MTVLIAQGGGDDVARWRWMLSKVARRIWLRAALFSLAAIGLALLAAVAAPFVPYDLSAKIGAKSVDNILEILASSMLAVTTFSMSAMVSAYAGAASNITPRATRLLIEDSRAQNALSTFMGAFLFSIVGICALSTGAYGEKGRVILFIGTIAVIALIAFALLRWIEHLSHFGRMLETIQRVEQVAKTAVCALPYRLHLHAADAGDEAPPHSQAVPSRRIGYVTHVDVPQLERVAAAHACRLTVTAPPGAFVAPGRPVVRVEGDLLPSDHRMIASAFTIEDSRAFDHDPRFGLVVLSEIASRALSPAVNDPGTAIAVVGAGLRVLSLLLTHAPARAAEPAGRVRPPRLALEDLLEDLFRPIARDGAGLIEVDLQVQKALGALRVIAPHAAELIRRRAADCLKRAEAALSAEEDLALVRAAFAEHQGA